MLTHAHELRRTPVARATTPAQHSFRRIENHDLLAIDEAAVIDAARADRYVACA
jgi:hypothetical protein